MKLSKEEKKDFLKKVVVFVDTREKKNSHIIEKFKEMGIMHESKKLDYGDYSFSVENKDFSCSCVIERKSGVNEVYGNISADRERIEKELDTISRNANQCTFLIENVKDWEWLKTFELSDFALKGNQRKVKNIGETCYSTLQSWQCGNRYNFKVEFVQNDKNTAVKMLELFYWYWHNYKKSTASRR